MGASCFVVVVVVVVVVANICISNSIIFVITVLGFLWMYSNS